MGQVRFFTYSQYHGKSDPVGSDKIRVHQVLKYWDEAELYKYGEFPDVLIFTKVFASPDYQFPKHFENIKILDICDPMWFEGHNVVETCQAMDAITCPTPALADFIKQFHNNVHVIPDRWDVDILPPPKKHKGKAKKVVWFGYSHNATTLKPAAALIDELELDLTIISNNDPFASQWSTRQDKQFYKFIKHHEETITEELQKCDFAIFPQGTRPEDVFKSNNKTVRANLAGLPVARTAEDVRYYMEGANRQKWQSENYDSIKFLYDVRHSVEDYKEVIAKVSED